MMIARALRPLARLLVPALLVTLSACIAAGPDDDVEDELDDVSSDEDALAPGGGTYSMRFDIAIPMCPAARLDAGKGCATDDEKCLCRPEFDALNSEKGTPGNPNGKVIVISQPEYGKWGDGTYAFDAYAEIKGAGNVVGHYVNELNPSRACTADESWSDVSCPGGGGCGWRCVSGAERADEIIDEAAETYTGRIVPRWIALNEAWSLIYDDHQAGVAYRTWIRDLVRRMATRGKRPILYLQERHAPAGSFTLLGETAKYAWIGVEAYLSGREVLNAPDRCAPPYGASNWCTKKYAEVREAVRSSASPPIPYDRLIMIEHFATNTWHADGRTNGWGRAFDDDASSPTHGTPTTHTWSTIIERRARAVKALPALAGVSSYAWAGNGSGTGSSYRVGFAKTYAGVTLP